MNNQTPYQQKQSDIIYTDKDHRRTGIILWVLASLIMLSALTAAYYVGKHYQRNSDLQVQDFTPVDSLVIVDKSDGQHLRFKK